jgi:hypothetical protein
MDLDHTIKLAVQEHQSGNVRFYACCRIADLLATNTDAVANRTLNAVAGASSFTTDFFGTNRFTTGFFTPGYREGPFQVREVIERRLTENRHATDGNQ